ncbi:MAG: hypothetical protein IJ802_05990 [Kiritimatiellae bacterium]|nr:hypothetical protein [Kiritimatiellia bacterium]
MPDKSILIKLCTEKVYSDNIFHLLGLQTSASAREIRRRREDLEAAHNMGADAWKREFGHLLATRPVPAFEEIEEAFEHVEDPEYRIASEFFWLWPLDEDDTALKALAEGNKTAAFNIWEQAAAGFGKQRFIAQHNIAVAYQLYAIDAELQAILAGEMPQPLHLKMCNYWKESFQHWEELADNDDFWNIFETRMREFDDPRLNRDFVRRFRIQFPIAFDNINAHLAAEWAKHRRPAEAKRHVDYMRKTMRGLDNVEESLRILFEPMERKITALIKKHDDAARQNPGAGLDCAKALLDESAEIVRIVQSVLDSNQRTRREILTGVFRACNRYLAAYANKTKEWDACLEMLKRLSPLACTDETEKQLAKNIEIVAENAKVFASRREREEAQKTCCGCGKKEGQKTFWGSIIRISLQEVSLFGKVQRDYSSFGAVRYATLKINVPHCQKCGRLKEWQILEYKPIALAIKDGYELGDKPSRSAMRKAWGLPPTESTLPRRNLF